MSETAKRIVETRRTRVRPKVVAVASGGGHWAQLQRLLPAFDDADVVWVSTEKGHGAAVGSASFRQVTDASRWTKLRALRCAVQMVWVIGSERPDVVVSTGALPGYFALLFGKVVRARTIWIDSIANADELSMSGQQAGRLADVWITQWPHLATAVGPYYFGNVMGAK